MRTMALLAFATVSLMCMVGCGRVTTTGPQEGPPVPSLLHASRSVSTEGRSSSSIHASAASLPSGSVSSGSTASSASAIAPAAPPNHLVRIYMEDASTGWATSGDDLFFTRNGPTNWQNVTPTGAEAGFAAPFFLDRSAWLFSNARCAVFFTNDGGVNWSVSAPVIASSSSSASLCDGPAHVSFANPSDGYLAFGPEAMQTAMVALYATTNGGKTWGLVPSTPPVASLFAVTPQLLIGVSPDSGDATRPPGGILWQSRNGGVSWDAAPMQYPAQIGPSSLGRSPIQVDGILAVAGSVRIAVHLGQTLWLEKVNPTGPWARMGPVLMMPSSSGGVSVHFFSSSSDVIAWDARNGAVFQTTENGTAWVDVSSTSTLVGAYATFASPTLGWAMASGALFATSDGGETWQTLPYTIAPQSKSARASVDGGARDSQ